MNIFLSACTCTRSIISLFIEQLGVLSLSKVAWRPSGWPWHDYRYRTDNHLPTIPSLVAQFRPSQQPTKPLTLV